VADTDAPWSIRVLYRTSNEAHRRGRDFHATSSSSVTFSFDFSGDFLTRRERSLWLGPRRRTEYYVVRSICDGTVVAAKFRRWC
jgi:hypothetical protein